VDADCARRHTCTVGDAGSKVCILSSPAP
jgi:hypothetical protein